MGAQSKCCLSHLATVSLSLLYTFENLILFIQNINFHFLLNKIICYIKCLVNIFVQIFIFIIFACELLLYVNGLYDVIIS